MGSHPVPQLSILDKCYILPELVRIMYNETVSLIFVFSHLTAYTVTVYDKESNVQRSVAVFYLFFILLYQWFKCVLSSGGMPLTWIMCLTRMKAFQLLVCIWCS